jgi:methionyl-tRNA formyltransferase
MSNLKIGILASGKLGAICVEHLLSKSKIELVMTDRSSDSIIELCNLKSIPVFIGNPRNGNAASFIKHANIDVLFSINYLFIVENDILTLPRKYAINLHGSLLPKYRGRTPHVWAIINNEKETGITAHLMTDKCDEGEILYQERIEINENATGNDLLLEFFHKYPVIISKVIKMIENNTVFLLKQDDSKATYFEKRTPDDGEINWNWHKERIQNWVRALSKPYPGAFTYYDGEKIKINRVEYSDAGFHQNDSNGKILDIKNHVIVKTPNGAIVLTDMEMNDNIKFEIGKIFTCKTF